MSHYFFLSKKAFAEGKPIDKNIFSKREMHRAPLANWKELSDYLREGDAARVKANALKRKMKKAYHMKKEQPLLNKTELMTKFAGVIDNSLKRKEKEAYPMKTRQQLLKESKLTDFARFRLTLPANALKRKKKEAYHMKKEQQLLKECV
jgi:hypothetical protein